MKTKQKIITVFVFIENENNQMNTITELCAVRTLKTKLNEDFYNTTKGNPNKKLTQTTQNRQTK